MWTTFIVSTFNLFKVIHVDFDPQTFDSYYNGCCNGTFWPLFHSMPDRAQFSVDSWKVIIDFFLNTQMILIKIIFLLFF